MSGFKRSHCYTAKYKLQPALPEPSIKNVKFNAADIEYAQALLPCIQNHFTQNKVISALI